MDRVAIDAGRIDAGLGKLVASPVVAFVDEDLVIDIARDDGELGAGNIFGGELGIVGRWCLRVARADGDVGRDLECGEAPSSIPKALMMPGAIAKAALTRGSCTESAGAGSSGSSSRRYWGDCLVVAPTLLKGEVLLGIDLGAADPERGEASLR